MEFRYTALRKGIQEKRRILMEVTHNEKNNIDNTSHDFSRWHDGV